MYLEIIHSIVEEILKDDKLSKSSIIIQLTPNIYSATQLEINNTINFTSEIPIEKVTAESIVMYGRTITIKQGNELDSRVEKRIVKELEKLKELNKKNN